MKTTDLKPCPFCGAMATMYQYTYPNGQKVWRDNVWHECGCYLDNVIDAEYETPEKLAEAWNMRCSYEEP